MYAIIKEDDMGSGDGTGKLDKVAIVEALKEKKGIMTITRRYQ